MKFAAEYGALITLLALFSTVVYNKNINNQQRAILDGYESPERPFFVQIYIEKIYIPDINKTEKYICGGTIIHKDFVVSAAHCFDLPGQSKSLTKKR